MKDNLNWAVLGTGVIANEMAQNFAEDGQKSCMPSATAPTPKLLLRGKVRY